MVLIGLSFSLDEAIVAAVGRRARLGRHLGGNRVPLCMTRQAAQLRSGPRVAAVYRDTAIALSPTLLQTGRPPWCHPRGQWRLLELAGANLYRPCHERVAQACLQGAQAIAEIIANVESGTRLPFTWFGRR